MLETFSRVPHCNVQLAPVVCYNGYKKWMPHTARISAQQPVKAVRLLLRFGP